MDLESGYVKFHGSSAQSWSVTLIDTGLDTIPSGRVKRMRKFMDSEPFPLTCGDGLSNVNIDKQIEYHCVQKRTAISTTVRPSARFGEIVFNKAIVESFKEKPQTEVGWTNGGFFVFESEVFDYIDNDATVLEKEPLEVLSDHGQLAAYQHRGFLQCMDTKRDRDMLKKLIERGFCSLAELIELYSE